MMPLRRAGSTPDVPPYLFCRKERTSFPGRTRSLKGSSVKSLIAAAALSLLSICHAYSAPLGKPTGPVILSVSGAIENTNAPGVAQFDMAMLEALAGRTASMETPWTDKPTRFEGPMLRAVLEAVGAKGASLKVVALNDYAAAVPMGDAMNYDTMLATRMDGHPMSVRDKGPLFLIYPFDINPELYNEKYFSRSVWQISKIEVEK